MNIPGIGAAPSLPQIEDMIQTAASIKDTYISLECTNVVLDTTRIGMRTDTCAHQKPWWAEPATDKLHIPYHEDCAGPCSACEESAKRRANNSDNLSKPDFEEKMWLGKSPATSRTFPLFWTDRLMTSKYRWYHALEQKRSNFDRPIMNRMTVWRRYRKIAELTPSIKHPELHNPRGGRAAAGIYWVRVLGVKNATPLMAWKYAQTADFYLRHSIHSVERAMARLRKNGRTMPKWTVTNKPQFSEIRPDDEEDLIELDSVLPESSVTSEEPHKDDEDKLIEEDILQEQPTDISREMSPVVDEHPRDVIEGSPVTEFEPKSFTDRLQEAGEGYQETLDSFDSNDGSNTQFADVFGAITMIHGMRKSVRHCVTEFSAWLRWIGSLSQKPAQVRAIGTIFGFLCLSLVTGIVLGRNGLVIDINTATFQGDIMKWYVLIISLSVTVGVNHVRPDTEMSI